MPASRRKPLAPDPATTECYIPLGRAEIPPGESRILTVKLAPPPSTILPLRSSSADPESPDSAPPANNPIQWSCRPGDGTPEGHRLTLGNEVMRQLPPGWSSVRFNFDGPVAVEVEQLTDAPPIPGDLVSITGAAPKHAPGFVNLATTKMEE